VATSRRLLKSPGLFRRIYSLLQGSFAKETYNFKEPTNRSHPISLSFIGLLSRFLVKVFSFGLFYTGIVSFDTVSSKRQTFTRKLQKRPWSFELVFCIGLFIWTPFHRHSLFLLGF